MKRNLLIALAVVACLVVYVLIAKRPVSMQNTSPSNSSPSASTTQTTEPSPVAVSPDFGKQSLLHLGQFTNASTGITIAFKEIPGDGRNSVDAVYVGTQKIGEITGAVASVFGFSPGSSYFAIRTMSILGGSDRDFAVSVANLRAAKLVELRPRRQSGPYPSNQYKPLDLNLYIASATWENDHSLDITSFYLWPDFNDASQTISYARVSPEETWSYDLATGSSTLINTTP